MMGVQDDYNEAWEAGAKDATERCALLVEMRAGITRKSARKIREAGSYPTYALWPPFKRGTSVHPKWERAARDLEEVAQAFEVVAHCIRLGFDPRNIKEKSDT
jgi:hypothetical protein